MAKQRMIQTRFWDDSYVARMSPNEKLVFLYLLTNPLTTIAGVYELSLKRAAFDVGLSMREIGKVFDRLESDKKIIRENDWIAVVNFIRHQSLNPKVKRGIEIELENAPKSLVERLNPDFDILSQPINRLSHPNPNPNLNLNLNSKINFNSNSNSNSKGPEEGKFSTGFLDTKQEQLKEIGKRFRI